MSAFNGSGTFVITGVGLPFVTATTISSTVANQLNTDLATGLSTCLTKDGQTTPTANIPMGGFKVTGIAVATATGDALSYGRAATVTTIHATSTATFDALTDISAAAAGQIKFPATQNPSVNANTLDDYEEGTWTPSDGSGAGLTFTAASGQYIKIGRLVQFIARVGYPATADGSNSLISGLPFTNSNGDSYLCPVTVFTSSGTATQGYVPSNAASIAPVNLSSASLTNANLSGINLRISGSYQAAA